MESADAELSSLTTLLEEVLGRVTTLAEALAGPGADHGSAETAGHLFEAERGLATAARRLGEARRSLRGA